MDSENLINIRWSFCMEYRANSHILLVPCDLVKERTYNAKVGKIKEFELELELELKVWLPQVQSQVTLTLYLYFIIIIKRDQLEIHLIDILQSGAPFSSLTKEYHSYSSTQLKLNWLSLLQQDLKLKDDKNIVSPKY